MQYRLGLQGLYATRLPPALLALYPQVVVILRLDLQEKQQTGYVDSNLPNGGKAQLAQYPESFTKTGIRTGLLRYGVVDSCFRGKLW